MAQARDSQGRFVGSAFIDVQPQLGSGFQAAIAAKINPIMGAVAGIAGGILAGGLAAGFAAFKIGETFDTAFDQIRIQTGATGDELAGLQEDFKAVFAAVPTDAATAGDAIAGLAQRLNLSGAPLQELSAQILELSRITETDLDANIESVTRTFGDWGIAVSEQGATLDQLFRASQETGIGVAALGSQLVQFGAPLRQLGFDFETSAALIAQFEKEGVNAELVLGSLRIALGRMAKDGEPAQETLARVTEEIANAGSASEANALALELFGARAGPDMAAAIREGRFEVSALYDTIANGEDTIATAGAETQDFAEKWNVFKNGVLVALEPIATRVFEGIGNLIDEIGPDIEMWINGSLLPAIDKFSVWWDENGPGIMDAASTIFGVIGDVISTVVGHVQTVIGWFQKLGSSEGASGAFASILAFAQETWPKIQGVISSAVEFIRALIERVVIVITAIWDSWGTEIMAVAGFIWDTIKTVISTALDVIGGIFDLFAAVFSGDWGAAWEAIKSIFSSVWNGIKGILENVLGIITTIFSRAWEEVSKFFVSTWENIADFFSDVWDNIVETVSTGIDNVVEFFVELPGKIMGFLKVLPGQMIEFGKDLVGGILEGLGNLGSQVYESIKGAIGGAIESAKNFFGISSPSTVFRDQLGIPFGQGVVVGFEEGLQPRQMLAATNAALASISGAALPSFGSSGFGTGTDGNLALATAPTMVTLYLDPEGKEKLAEFVVDWANRHIRQVSRAGG